MPVTEVTPYSTIDPELMRNLPDWLPTDQDKQRLRAYTVYEAMYWNVDETFELIKRDEDGSSLYIPRPKTIVDITAHYLLKGMAIGVKDPSKNTELVEFLDNFIKRERFYSRFQVAKLAGVSRGDWVFHITADPTKPEDSRISLTSVDPALYFPELDPDDYTRRIGAKLVEPQIHPTDPDKMVVKVLRYWYNLDPETGDRVDQLVYRQEDIWEVDNWFDPEKAKKVKQTLAPETLPTDITQIPLYHFKNADWDGYEFGNSELKGYERIFQAINQTMSDTEIALALVGLGVYATDAGRPRDPQTGAEADWVVVPGTVWEMPGATMVKRLEGITSVTPVLDFVGYLDSAIFQANGTTDVALGNIDVAVAESGIALAIKFMPTLAKIEYRDTAGVEVLTQLWYDWKFWVKAYENKDFTAVDILITLGEKLPVNRKNVFDELNQMVDRKIISKQFYRDEIQKRLDYVFPAGMDKQIIDEMIEEMRARMELEQEFMPEEADDGNPQFQGAGGRKEGAGDTKSRQDRNQSNNKSRVNESKGTEVR